MTPFNEITDKAESAAKAGAWWLFGLSQPRNGKGRFIYEYKWELMTTYSFDVKQIKHNYNLLRHCGALWSIITTTFYLEKFSHEAWAEMFAPKILTSLDYIAHKNSIYISDERAMLVTWHKHVKLGANALYLLAMAELIEKLFVCGKTFDELQVLIRQADMACNGLYLMFVDDISAFIHKMDEQRNPVDFESDYYIGEALFAILRWKNVCKRHNIIVTHPKEAAVIQHMLELAKNNYGLKFQSHWMVYAVTEYMQFTEYQNRDVMHSYLVNLIDDILINATYRKRGESTPISCRTEALVRAAEYFYYNDATRYNNCMLHAEANIAMQLGFCKPGGAVIRGGKGSDANHVRIDYIQHAISGFTNYIKLVKRQIIREMTDPHEDSEFPDVDKKPIETSEINYTELQEQNILPHTEERDIDV